MKVTLLLLVALTVAVGMQPAVAFSKSTEMQFMLNEIVKTLGNTGNEKFYSDIICKRIFNGTGTTLESRRQPDCETAFLVMEFDWGQQTKLYECIGQALAYSYETKKFGVCIVLAKDEKQLLKALEFVPIFDHAGIAHMIIPLYKE